MPQSHKNSYNYSGRQNSGKTNQWLISIAILIIIGIFAPNLLNNPSDPSTINNSDSVNNSLIENFTGYNFEIFPKMTKIPVEYLSANDGDTITVRLNNHKVKVRYLMIDTPEMNYDNGSAHPDFMAQEAYDRNVELLTKAKQVYLALDVGPATDNYNRALAYIYADDLLISEVLIKEGLGTVRYVNPPNNSLENVLREAESVAKENKLGLWQ